MSFIADIRTLLLALWLGAAIYFSGAVAQSAFGVLPSRELAGSVVNRTLAILNYAGIIIGLILLASSFLKDVGINRIKIWIERLLLLFFTAACAFGQFVIAGQLQNLRLQIGQPIDEVPLDHPLRVAFNDLHQYSVAVLSAAIIAALIAYFFLTSRARNNSIQ